MSKEVNKKTMWIIICVIGVLLIAVGISFAWWTLSFQQTGENVVTSDCFHVTFTEDENNINLNNAIPILDSEGRMLTPYTFQIQNTCSSGADYQIKLEEMNTSTLSDEYLKVLINQENEEGTARGLNTYKETETSINNTKRARIIYEGYLSGNETKTFSFRLWMDENVTMEDTAAMNKTYSAKISITTSYAMKYKEDILHGTNPVLKDGLIPVTIENDGTVKKANEKEEWYSYSNQRWANAVILEDESVTYQNNEVIPEDNIESYFVWIPKYRYKLWDLGEYETLSESVEEKEQTIDIIFGDYDTTDKAGECKTPGVSGETGNCKVGDYMTHPAFQAFGTTGLWVGKFETGYKGATNTEGAESNTYDTEKIEIKPNVYSWRGIQVVNAHLNSYNYKREYDSHMMKNTEWGAVAYLQHSLYGSRASVRINNNSTYITGYGAVNEPTCGYTRTNEDCNKYESTALNTDGTYTKRYNTEKGYSASTTGNITGIYDMSGGAWEYVMGVMMPSDNKTPCAGSSLSNTSGFAGPYCYTSGTASGEDFPDAKFYDTYVNATNEQTYTRRILGDATGEMGPFANATYGRQTRQIIFWYADEAWFVHSGPPWFTRGANLSHGSGAGVFAFANGGGSAFTYTCFRVVLAF